MSPDEWVQPVLVGPEGSHLGVVEAVAKASVLALAASPEDPAWAQWLSGSFTKTVRRARVAALAAVEDLGGVRATGPEGASAVALPPMRYCDLPRPVSKAQVQGLVREAPEPSWRPAPGLWVVLRASVGMSTGKAAAQAAHALMAAALADEGQDPAAVAHSASFAWVVERDFQTLLGLARVVIADAGRTEIPAGTETAVALQV